MKQVYGKVFPKWRTVQYFKLKEEPFESLHQILLNHYHPLIHSECIIGIYFNLRYEFKGDFSPFSTIPHEKRN